MACNLKAGFINTILLHMIWWIRCPSFTYCLLLCLGLSFFYTVALFVYFFFFLSLFSCANHKNINSIMIGIFFIPNSSSVYLWFDEFIYSRTIPWLLIDENNIIGPLRVVAKLVKMKVYFFRSDIFERKMTWASKRRKYSPLFLHARFSYRFYTILDNYFI